MSYDTDALAGFEEFFARVQAGLQPGARKRASGKLGRALRRANLKRQAENVTPDGGAMEPRKPRRDARGRLRRKAGGKMFRRLRFARNWKVDARPDSVEILLKSGERVAAVHHFGLVGIVGKDGSGNPVKYKYPARRLLGFSADDERFALEVAEEMLDPDAR